MDIDRIEDMARTTANFIYFLAYNQFKPEIMAQSLHLKQSTGSVLRIDHTYKAVKHLSAYSYEDAKRV